MATFDAGEVGSTFGERMDVLRELTGGGFLKADIEVNQVYARYQTGWGDLGDGSGTTGVITPTEMSYGPKGKPGPMFDHPHGGHAGYLSGFLTEVGPSVAQAWADAVGERLLSSVTIEQAERVATHVGVDAPLEVGILRGSASVKVAEDGATIYTRPALVGRLSQEAIDVAHGDIPGGFAVTGSKRTAPEEIHDMPEESE